MTQTIPLHHVKIDSPLLLKLASFFSDEKGTCLLYSGGSFDTATKSFLCLFPFDFIHIHPEKQWRSYHDGERRMTLSLKNPWEALGKLLSDFQYDNPFPEWVGFLGYETEEQSELEKQLQLKPATSPDTYLQRSAVVLVVDHCSNSATLHVADQAYYFLDEKQKGWIDFLFQPNNWLEFLQNLSDAEMGVIEELPQNPYRLFYQMASTSATPFSSYLRMDDMAVVSSSVIPVQAKEQRAPEMCSIKWTAPQGQAAEAVSTLEKRARSINKGAIGYIAGNGDLDFNIPAKTLFLFLT